MIACRTLPRFTEGVFTILAVLVLALGVVLIGVGIATRQGTISVSGAIFLAVGVRELAKARETAAELELCDGGSLLRWRSSWGSGEVATASLHGITRSTRPDVYAFDLESGDSVRFWLFSRDRTVQGFFAALHEAAPQASFNGLYSRGRIWWRGLPQ